MVKKLDDNVERDSDVERQALDEIEFSDTRSLSDDLTVEYTEQGSGAGWDGVPRHHHPTQVSDVLEEEVRNRHSEVSGNEKLSMRQIDSEMAAGLSTAGAALGLGATAKRKDEES
jgi:hypothetical protein